MELTKIKELLAEKLDCEPDTITEETTFEDLGVDSLDVVELLMSVEDEFGVSMDPDPSLKSIGDLIAKIKELQA